MTSTKRQWVLGPRPRHTHITLNLVMVKITSLTPRGRQQVQEAESSLSITSQGWQNTKDPNEHIIVDS